MGIYGRLSGNEETLNDKFLVSSEPSLIILVAIKSWNQRNWFTLLVKTDGETLPWNLKSWA